MTPVRLLAPLAAHEHRETTVSSPLCGSLEVMPIFDVIQWVCSSHQSWQVHLLEKEVEAYVAIVDGELADARWGNQIGHEALVNILDTKTGRFELRPVNGESQRTLRGSWILTLLTATQKADERCSRDSEPRTTEANTDDTRPKLPGESGEHQLEMPQSLHLVDLGFAAMRSGDIEQARLLWTQALEQDPNNRALQFNLRKLATLPPPPK
jgi:hypothetical protein